MHLLVSLGTAWAVVPEAFLHPDHQFSAVHVLTTGATEKIDAAVVGMRDWFAERAPDVVLTVTRLQGITDILKAEDHEAFEEVLFRWFGECRAEAKEDGAGIQVCLAGGFKTMSAAMQQAAEVFGCDGLFHVLAGGNPASAEAIAQCLQRGEVNWIELGPRAGWPEFRWLEPQDWPLERDESLVWVTPPVPDSRSLRRRVAESLRRFQRIAERWDRLEELPFRALAALSEAELAWLRDPLDPEADASWVRALPKVELHCHLGGFATQGADLTAVRAAAVEPQSLPERYHLPDPDGWPLPATPCGLKSYMRLGDNNGSALLKDPGCLKRQIELLYAHLCRENVRYAEIRCSPGNYADAGRGRSAWDVLSDILGTFDECRNRVLSRVGTEAPKVNLIIIATRRAGGDFRTEISRHLSLAVTAAGHWRKPEGSQVIGVDLAGYEDRETRAHYFREDFTAVHRAGLAVTVHAGENDDAEAIWSAVFDLNARRIGHALHLVHSPVLLEAMAARGVGIEMCPYANQQIVGFSLGDGDDRPRYPLPVYLQQGLPVTVNTDNPGISGASLSDNLLLAARLCPGLTRLDLLRLIANAARTSFLPEPRRQALLSQLGEEAIRKPLVGA
jgi:adenosine deaminase